MNKILFAAITILPLIANADPVVPVIIKIPMMSSLSRMISMENWYVMARCSPTEHMSSLDLKC